MHLSVTTSSVFKTVADCMEYLEHNNGLQLFHPSRAVTSIPETGNYLLLPEINRRIAGYLSFSDFVNFSAINVDNYINLRGDKALERQILKNEAKHKEILVFRDLKQRSSETRGGKPVTIESKPGWYHTTSPHQAFKDGHAQLTCNTGAGDFKVYREACFGIFFYSLCQFATNESVNSSFRSYCSLRAIAVNNILDMKGEMMAVYYARGFLEIAKEVNNGDEFENKEDKGVVSIKSGNAEEPRKRPATERFAATSAPQKKQKMESSSINSNRNSAVDKIESLYKLIVGQNCNLSILENIHVYGKKPDLTDWSKYIASLQNNRESKSIPSVVPKKTDKLSTVE